MTDLQRLYDAIDGRTKGKWTRKPLTSWDDRGKHENHNWNTIKGAETADGYDRGSFGPDKSKPWGGEHRDDPEYIALPDAVFIALMGSCADEIKAVLQAAKQLTSFDHPITGNCITDHYIGRICDCGFDDTVRALSALAAKVKESVMQ